VPVLSFDVDRDDWPVPADFPGIRLVFWRKPNLRELEHMTTIKTLIMTICMTGLFSAAALAQSATPPRINAADAKNHHDETVTVCGKVVDTKVSKYGIGGRGKPVNFDLDQPEPNPVFFFTTFGTETGGPDEAIAAYKGKNVCVTGKVAAAASLTFILAADRTQIKVQADSK
jgi:hypothetical protein